MYIMGISLDDPLIQIGLFFAGWIIVTGISTFFGYSSDAYGIYMAFIGFMILTSLILPNSINIAGPISDVRSDDSSNS